MSKKILAALLAVMMVLSLVPMTAFAAEAPKEVIAANLTYRDGFEGPAFGQASEYTATLTRGTDGTKNVKITAKDLVMSVNPDSEADPARATYQVGVGILIPEGNNLWAYRSYNPIPEDIASNKDKYRFWPNEDPYNFRQTENGKNYATFYSQGTIAALNGRTMYISTLTKSPDGGLTKEVLDTRRDYVVTFDVSIPATKHTLTVTQPAVGGTITVKSADVTIDGSGAVTDNELVRVTAAPAENYKIKKVTYTYTENGEEKTVEAEKNTELSGEFTFNMPKADTTVTAEFEQGATEHTITVDSNTGGTVTVDATGNKAVENTVVTITVEPDTTHDIEQVYYKIGSGEKVFVYKNAEGKYTFAMPDNNVNVGATFTSNPTPPTSHTITVTPPGADGTIEVTPTTATVGQQIQITVTPAQGKKVTSVTYTGGSGGTANLQEGNIYIFIMPDADVTVSATFSAATSHTVTATDTADGTITFSPATEENKYNPGDIVTVNITPNSGHAVDTVTYTPDGDSLVTISLVNGKYSFTMPDKDVTVSATFTTNITPPPPVVDPPYSGGGSSSGTTGSVTVTKPANGTVTSNVTTAKEGDKVTVTVKPDASYYVVTGVTASGDSGTIRATKNADGTYSFTMPKGNVTVNTTIRHIYDLFTDVPTDIAEYGTAIKWAVEKNITLGTDPANYSTFGPYSPCTRAQMVVFLYRAAGSPAVTGTNSFTDLPSDNEIQKAVQWAVSKDITKGTSSTTFDPYAPCTRGQMVTFLHRNHSEPAATGSNSFADVPADAFYKTAVQWAVNSGVTKGTSDTTFDPISACTRVQMVTFLYRDMGK